MRREHAMLAILAACLLAEFGASWSRTSPAERPTRTGPEPFSTLTPEDTVALMDAPAYVGPWLPGGPDAMTRSEASAAWLEGATVSDELAKGWRVVSPKPPEGARIVAGLEGATVTVTRGSKTTTCRRTGASHACGKAGWQAVEERTLTIGGKKETCVWAHPLDGAVLTVTLPHVSSTEDDPARLSTAIIDKVAMRGAPVKVDVTFADATLTHTHAARRRGFQSVELPPGDGPLRLAISAKNVGQRHFCFEVT